jgi:hypothetical protein
VRISIVTLIAICCGCSGTVHDPDGHYVLESYSQQGRYFTLDIVDSIVLLNKSSVFKNQRDTIFIDPTHNTFRRAASNPLNIFGFRTEGDSIVLSYGTNGDGSELVFVKREENIDRDIYANSLLDVEPTPCEPDCKHSHISETTKTRHLLVGPPKPGVAPGMMLKPDSVLMEFHNLTFLDMKNLQALTREMKKAGEDLCLHIDKDIPNAKVIALRTELRSNSNGMTIFESRMKDGKLVFIESPVDQIIARK